ncbi:MAG: hypothetical protein P9M03_11950, partial [Candidatus Theseobacter exili]|nr:hypothetical protein [Candidatus Theseobacter exili]
TRASLAKIEEILDRKIPLAIRWVRTSDALSILGCSESQLQRYRSQDRIIWKKVGNTVYHLRDSLNDLIENEK